MGQKGKVFYLLLALVMLSTIVFMLTGLLFGHVARKPVFGVSVKASFKPVSTATETS